MLSNFNLEKRMLYYYYFKKCAVQGRERVTALHQSEDPNPTQLTHAKKKYREEQ